MPIGQITIQDIYEASQWNHYEVACEILMEKGAIRDRTLFEMLVSEELWVNTESRPRRMQMLLEWVLCEFAFEVRDSAETAQRDGAGAAQASSEERWSLPLRDETRKCLLDPRLSRISDGKLHLKNIDGSFGYISVENLLKGRFETVGKGDSGSTIYTSAEDVVRSGWVID